MCASPQSGRENVLRPILSARWGSPVFSVLPRGLRRGLHSFAASRLVDQAASDYTDVSENCDSVFCSDASSLTVRHVLLRSICLISPQRTFPGPTSINKFTPFSISSRMDGSHLTEPVTWRTRASRAGSAAVTGAASTLQTTGQAGE